jgi:hypothetical protein
MRAKIDALNETEPWSFDGEDFVQTLALIDLREGALTPPFAEDLELRLPYLLVEHVAHVPETTVFGFPTLPDLEQAILSGSGLTNFFTTHCIAFVQGEARRYRIFYRDEAGKELVFSKSRQIARNKLSVVYGSPRIEWC